MSTKLLGQFLLERGMITRDQLLHALREQRTSYPWIGELAVALGYLGATDTELIRLQQRHRDQPFGEIAVDTGFLTREQVAELLDYQRASKRLMGEILVAHGYITAGQLETALQALSETADSNLASVVRDPWNRGREEFADLTIGVMMRVYQRLFDLPLQVYRKAERHAALKRPTWQQVVMNGPKRHTIELHADQRSATFIASRILESEVREMGDLAIDAVGEFLNTVVGHVCGKMRPHAAGISARPPRFLQGDALAEAGGLGYTAVALDGAGAQIICTVGVEKPRPEITDAGAPVDEMYLVDI